MGRRLSALVRRHRRDHPADARRSKARLALAARSPARAVRGHVRRAGRNAADDGDRLPRPLAGRARSPTRRPALLPALVAVGLLLGPLSPARSSPLAAAIPVAGLLAYSSRSPTCWRERRRPRSPSPAFQPGPALAYYSALGPGIAALQRARKSAPSSRCSSASSRRSSSRCGAMARGRTSRRRRSSSPSATARRSSCTGRMARSSSTPAPARQRLAMSWVSCFRPGSEGSTRSRSPRRPSATSAASPASTGPRERCSLPDAELVGHHLAHDGAGPGRARARPSRDCSPAACSTSPASASRSSRRARGAGDVPGAAYLALRVVAPDGRTFCDLSDLDLDAQTVAAARLRGPCTYLLLPAAARARSRLSSSARRATPQLIASRAAGPPRRRLPAERAAHRPGGHDHLAAVSYDRGACRGHRAGRRRRSFSCTARSGSSSTRRRARRSTTGSRSWSPTSGYETLEGAGADARASAGRGPAGAVPRSVPRRLRADGPRRLAPKSLAPALAEIPPTTRLLHHRRRPASAPANKLAKAVTAAGGKVEEMQHLQGPRAQRLGGEARRRKHGLTPDDRGPGRARHAARPRASSTPSCTKLAAYKASGAKLTPEAVTELLAGGARGRDLQAHRQPAAAARPPQAWRSPAT